MCYDFRMNMVNKYINFLKNNCQKMGSFILKNSIISTLLVFGFFLISFLSIYMSIPVLSSGDDHYFHFRFVERLLNNRFFDSFRDFKNIYFTNVTNGGHFLYYNFIFYVVLIPFSLITPLYLGIKLFAVTILSIIGTILYFIFKKLDIRYAFLWAVGFFSAIGLGSFWRLFLSRPFVFSPIIILLLILAIHKKQYFWIFLLSFIPLFWHTATFFVPILVMGVYFLCYGFYYRKYLWRELLLVFLGVLSAVLVVTMIDNGFFISIRDNLFKVLFGIVGFVVDKVNIAEGSEVYVKNFFDLFNNNILLCLMFLFSVVIYVSSLLKEIKVVLNFDNVVKRKKVVTMVFFVLSSVFIVLIPIISGRFADFFIFFGWIFVVLVITELFSQIEFTKLNIKKFFIYAVFVCLIYLFSNSALQLNDELSSNGNHPEAFSEVGGYLSKNLKKGDIVFNLNWSWFPQLYYYAPEQYYVIGLEPKLTYLYDPKLYWLWANLSKGYVCDTENCPKIDQIEQKEMRNKKNKVWLKEKGENIANAVINDFKSHYIVSTGDYTRLNLVLDSSKRFEKVFTSSNQFFVYKVLPK